MYFPLLLTLLIVQKVFSVIFPYMHITYFDHITSLHWFHISFPPFFYNYNGFYCSVLYMHTMYLDHVNFSIIMCNFKQDHIKSRPIAYYYKNNITSYAFVIYTKIECVELYQSQALVLMSNEVYFYNHCKY